MGDEVERHDAGDEWGDGAAEDEDPGVGGHQRRACGVIGGGGLQRSGGSTVDGEC